MTMLMRGWLLGLLAAMWLVPAAAAAAAGGPLVDAAWLARNLPRADLVLLDAQPTPLYRKQHIAGAVHVDVFGGGPVEAPPAQIERRFQSWGLADDKTVVIYDRGGSYEAMRVFFDLVHRGFPPAQLHVLDGGMAKWLAGGGAVTAEPTPAPAAGTFRIRAVEGVRARLPEFLAATADPKAHAVIDALDATMYYGETGFIDRYGHVPHALSWPSQDLFNADKTMKSPAELRRMLRHLGIDAGKPVYTYCGGGGAAAVPFFALKYVLGYPDVKLYVESQMEWLADPRSLPVWTYAEPALLRDAGWLKGWGGPLARMYGIAQVSIVDVRPPADYQMGHVPFALSIPAERLTALLDEPDRLAELFGQSGVDRVHEAVVVSEGGLNERSALAWLALWRAGQQRVSILTASTDRWGRLGHEIATEPTVVGTRKSPKDRVVAPTAYAAAARAGALLRAAPAADGSGTRVFVASGRTPPAQPPAGRVVHLPYTTLLDADGTPRPAGALWQALTQAGVPRYAEIVVIGDTAGEAAVNFFILRLMGFSDVKLLLPA